MLMDINITLVVQLISFIIAYAVLRIFLFKPVIAIINTETIERESLISLVEARTIIVQQKEMEKKERWIANQQEFSLIIPEVSRPELFVFKDIEPHFTLEPLNKELISRSVNQMTAEIIKKVEHGSF